MQGDIFIEENGFYQIDCSSAIWASNKINAEYQVVGNFLSDADYVIEGASYIYLVEYKNANIQGAANAKAFQPQSDKKTDVIARKFYDSIHYLTIHGKGKPVKYVYIVEYPYAGATDRKLLRNKISDRLPFKLQNGKIGKLIEDFEALSIEEWNNHADFSQFPLTPVVTVSAT